MNRICVYGLYRKGGVNYNYLLKELGKNSLLYKKTIHLYGYKMYDCIYYPSIIFTGNSEDKVVVDLLLANDEAYKYIKNFEDGSCFSEHLINIDDNFYSIFFQYPVNTQYHEVDDGDWIASVNY